MADHSKPTVTSTYTNFVTEIDARLDDISKWFKSSTVTGTYLAQNSVRWNDTSFKWEINTAVDGTQTPTWADFSSRYDININGTVGATTPSTGAFTTLSTTGVASLAANSTVGGVSIVTTTGTQTLTNKTLTSPTISSIVNSGTLTLPTATTTLVGTNTTDTLTNKTLTAPKFANAGFIADPSANEILEFGVTATAVNNVKITNAATGTAPVIEAVGGDTNITLNIKSKGTGAIQLNGVTSVDISTAQTLTNKTLSTSSVWNGGIIGNTYGGTGSSAAFVAGGVVYGSTTTALGTTAAGSAGQLLQSGAAGAPTWVNASSLSVNSATTAGNVTGTVALANGGTGGTTAATARTNLGLIIGTDIPGPTGAGASGTWSISINGNAATATSATTATTAANGGVTSVNGSTGAVSVIPNMAVITSTGIWTVPAGVTRFKFTLVGGGGAGGTPGYPYAGGGGGGGCTAIGLVAVGATTQFHITIGVGGAQVAGNGNDGLTSYLRRTNATGAVVASASGGAGGLGLDNQWNRGGAGGATATYEATLVNGFTRIGGGGGPGGNYAGAASGEGGESYLGGGGRGGDNFNNYDGQTPSGYGGGGGGGVFSTAAGSGAQGICVIEW